jgi:hypothetical protein
LTYLGLPQLPPRFLQQHSFLFKGGLISEGILISIKGVSDLKARLDYCKDPARNCENLDFCFPSQNRTILLADEPV